MYASFKSVGFALKYPKPLKKYVSFWKVYVVIQHNSLIE